VKEKKKVKETGTRNRTKKIVGGIRDIGGEKKKGGKSSKKRGSTPNTRPFGPHENKKRGENGEKVPIGN